MREIPLTQGKVALVDDRDFDRVSQFNWCAAYFPEADTWYAHRRAGGRTLRMHRFILGAKHGEEIDHRNGDGLDNRRENIRRCTHSQNRANTEKRGGLSRFKGVSAGRDGRWKARITYNGKLLSLGEYEDETEAARAYNRAASLYFGEFARLNGVDDPDNIAVEKPLRRATLVPGVQTIDRTASGTALAISPSDSRLGEHLARLEKQLERCPGGHFARRSWLEARKRQLVGDSLVVGTGG